MLCLTEYNHANPSQKTKTAPAAWNCNISASKSSVPHKIKTQMQEIFRTNKKKTEKLKREEQKTRITQRKEEKNIYMHKNYNQ